MRAARTRVCDGVVTGIRRDVESANAKWAGYIANQPVGGHLYTESDTDYFVPCVTGTYDTTYDESEWIGLGAGFKGGDPHNLNDYDQGTPLNQTGTDAKPYYDSISGSWYPQHWAWVENTRAGAPQGSDEIRLFKVNCGEHMFAKTWLFGVTDSNGSHPCMFIERLNDGTSSMNCYGPNASGLTAEAIVEGQVGYHLANFGSVTFKGVGITDYGHYYAVNQLPYDHATMYNTVYDQGSNCCNGQIPTLASVDPGGIQPDPGNVPYDKFIVNHLNYGLVTPGVECGGTLPPCR